MFAASRDRTGAESKWATDRVGKRAMTAAEEKAWRAAVGKRRRGRAAPDKGVTIVPLEIEPGLLKRADALAKKRGVSRARLVAEGLETLLANQRA